MDLKVKLLYVNAKVPTRANAGDLGFDLFALNTVVVQPGQYVTAATGVAFEFPEGWGAIIKARSSQGKVGIDIFGGVVDSGYRGEVKVMLYNSNIGEKNEVGQDNTVIYYAGDKIAQLVLVPVFPGSIQEVATLGESERGEKGFGSSGK